MLGGLRVDGSTSGAPTHEILIDMMGQAEAFGATLDVVIMHPLATANLTKQLEGKWVIMKAQGYDGEETDIGYKGWNVHLGGQDVTIMTDRVCPQKRIYSLQLDTWTLFSAGSDPGFLQKRGGSIMKPSENSDAWEARVGEYINASCVALAGTSSASCRNRQSSTTNHRSNIQ